MTEVRGLCLYSTATQKGDLSALASLHDTSWEWDHSTGHSDKTPVLIQNLPDKERSLMHTQFYPGRGNISVPLIRNPVSSLGGQSASRLSLCPVGRSPTMAGQTTGCLSAPRVYHEQMSLYSANSSPWLEARGLLGADVEKFAFLGDDGDPVG